MLFTDGMILSLQDLRDHDNFVLEVASTEAIELSSKMKIAQRSMEYEIAAFLSTRETPVPLHRVVVNDELKDSLAIKTLALVYSDAYNRHLNDRYLGKAKDLRQASEHSFHRLLQNGVGIVSTPVPRAEKPAFGSHDDGWFPGGLYDVQIAWQHASGTVGERSEIASAEHPNGGRLMVIPPASPAGITGWHVFIGVAGEGALRQNVLPIPVTEEWTQWELLRADLSGPLPSGPDYVVRLGTHLVRR